LAATTTDLTSNNPMRLLPIMAVLIAIVLLLVIIAVVIIIVMRGRRRPGQLMFLTLLLLMLSCCDSLYSEFHRFRQAKFDYGGLILSLSQFLLLPQLSQKVELTSKVVKVDSKIIISIPEI
jgi:hypothetical protein